MKPFALIAALLLSTSVLAEGKDPLTGGDAAAGATKAAVCAACHGPAGASSNPEWPKLAGQSSRYTYEQMLKFKSGARKNALMNAQAAALSDADMRDLAAYFAAQKPSPGVGSESSVAVGQQYTRAGDAKDGVSACAACHGPTGAGNAAAAYPRLGGQHATYLAAKLREYRSWSAEPKLEGNVKTMAQVAAKLSDAEIDALASYLNGLQ